MDRMEVTALFDSTPHLGDPGALRARAEEDGYLWLRGVHSPGAIDALRHRVLAASERNGWLAANTDPRDAIARPGIEGLAFDDPQWIALQVELYPSAELEAIRACPAVLATLAALLRANVAPQQGDICRLLFPNAPHRATSAHQDGAYVGAERECWTVWSPLTDCPISLGPLAILPGSHRTGLVAHATGAHAVLGATDVSQDGWVASDLRAGDALMFHQLTMHAALPNLSPDRLRISVDCRYRRGESGS
ncbi:MAG: phytanoyl-CoA dioxygenase family protein [Candidatus Eisenbacteria bacterium]|nr:phytanoyl-CoA dioxygenase family protein [Candidatus Eisenbacteria bacterium]